MQCPLGHGEERFLAAAVVIASVTITLLVTRVLRQADPPTGPGAPMRAVVRLQPGLWLDGMR